MSAPTPARSTWRCRRFGHRFDRPGPGFATPAAVCQRHGCTTPNPDPRMAPGYKPQPPRSSGAGQVEPQWAHQEHACGDSLRATDLAMRLDSAIRAADLLRASRSESLPAEVADALRLQGESLLARARREPIPW